MAPVRLLTARLRRAYLQGLYRLGGIEAINRRLLRVSRAEDILRQFGASVGAETVLYGPLVIHNAAEDYSNLTIGKLVHIGRLVVLDLAEQVVLGDEAVIAMGTTILTHSDIGERPLATRFPRITAPIQIGTGAFLGANVTVLVGCNVGRGALVGAGSVVTRPVPDDAVVAGAPARPLPVAARQG
jgi:acetyltransferase-like isoleucine patch superfamily enzyme